MESPNNLNQCACIAEVIGSSPLPPTIVFVLKEEFPLRTLLEMLLGPGSFS